jgi:hypothetical protein
MSLGVGIQSVVFYVLSCSTCSKISHRRKAKAVAKRERAEKQELETEQPGLYRHPSPFNTNPFWDEEIMLGPGPPARKGGSKNTSSRVLNSAGPGSSTASNPALSVDAASSPTIVPSTTDGRLSGSDWNHSRYQREDEELWGDEHTEFESNPNSKKQKLKDAIARAENSVGSKLRRMEERLSSTRSNDSGMPASSPYYFVSRNPPVNDLHPPVVSTTVKGATLWMLQPPPSARVMEGKERATRSRSASRGSSSKVDAQSLSRQVTGRAVEEKLRRGETPSDLELRNLSRKVSQAKTLVSVPSRETIPERLGRSRSHSGSSGEMAERRRRYEAAKGRRLSTDSIENVQIRSVELPDKKVKAPKIGERIALASPDSDPEDQIGGMRLKKEKSRSPTKMVQGLKREREMGVIIGQQLKVPDKEVLQGGKGLVVALEERENMRVDERLGVSS